MERIAAAQSDLASACRELIGPPWSKVWFDFHVTDDAGGGVGYVLRHETDVAVEQIVPDDFVAAALLRLRIASEADAATICSVEIEMTPKDYDFEFGYEESFHIDREKRRVDFLQKHLPTLAVKRARFILRGKSTAMQLMV